MFIPRTKLASTSFAALALFALASAQKYTKIDIPAPPGYKQPRVVGMSRDGSAVFMAGQNDLRMGTAFVWHLDTGWQDLGTLEGYKFSIPVAASQDLNTIVGLCSKNDVSPQSVGFIWTKADGMKLFSGPNGISAIPKEISLDGTVIAGMLVQGKETLYPTPFRWSKARGFDVYEGKTGQVTGMSGDGSVIVGSVLDGPESKDARPHPFRWSAETGFKDLSDAKHPVGVFGAVSEDGRIALAYVPESEFIGRTYNWLPSLGYVPLSPSSATYPYSANRDASMVAGGDSLWSKYGYVERHDYLRALGLSADAGEKFICISADGKRFLVQCQTMNGTLGSYILMTDGVLPVALPDRFGADKPSPIEVPVSYGILSNDAAGIGATVELVQGPLQAKEFALHPDGSFKYVPKVGIKSEDGFTYRAITADGKKTNVARVIISFGN